MPSASDIDKFKLGLPGPLYNSSQSGLTATAGGAQASIPLNQHVNVVSTVATIADSGQLPAAVPGRTIIVRNAAANSMNVFPHTGETINSGAANAAFAVAGGKNCMFVCGVLGNWIAVLSA